MTSSGNAPPSYNDILLQITINLSNTLNTFGPSSHQYKAVLQTLKDFIRDIETTVTAAEGGTGTTCTSSSNDKSNNGAPPDPDMLSSAMRFLKLEE